MVIIFHMDKWDRQRWEAAMRGATLSERTIQQRLGYVGRFAAWHDNPADATPDHISEWLADHNWSPETRKSARGALNAYFRWAVRTGRLPTNPVEHTDPTRIPATAPHPVPESVLHAAIEAAGSDTKLMLLLGAYAGLRRSEIATIRDTDLEGSFLRVHGKGGRTRMVPAHPRIVEMWPPRYEASPATVARRVKKALGGKWTTHSLRHRFATRFYQATDDVLLTQQVLGHSSPATTQRYVLLPPDAAVNAVTHMT